MAGVGVAGVGVAGVGVVAGVCAGLVAGALPVAAGGVASAAAKAAVPCRRVVSEVVRAAVSPDVSCRSASPNCETVSVPAPAESCTTVNQPVARARFTYDAVFCAGRAACRLALTFCTAARSSRHAVRSSRPARASLLRAAAASPVRPNSRARTRTCAAPFWGADDSSASVWSYSALRISPRASSTCASSSAGVRPSAARELPSASFRPVTICRLRSVGDSVSSAD